MATVVDPKSDEGMDSGPIARITGAATALQFAKELRSPTAISAAQNDLRRAVRAANDVGISWQDIGEALGVARGNAYQRYRRKPGAETTRGPFEQR